MKVVQATPRRSDVVGTIAGIIITWFITGGLSSKLIKIYIIILNLMDRLPKSWVSGFGNAV